MSDVSTPTSRPDVGDALDCSYGVPILGHLPRTAEPETAEPAPAAPASWKRRITLPLVLFLATCVSTFLSGSNVQMQSAAQSIRRHDGVVTQGSSVLLTFAWADGLVYMGTVMAILLAHEMGHFVTALRYRVPASLPYFIPMPFSPLGTMGAVISMQGSGANRRQLFDIGLAGPLAGLVIALPVSYLGIRDAVPAPLVAASDQQIFGDPLLFKILISWLHPELAPGQEIWMNPLLMAGWFGMLITGLNMLPVSQLDGGHVAYALFGRRAHLLARLMLFAAAAFMLFSRQYSWLLMLGIILFIGPDHPPTADDGARLGWARRVIGWASLGIPILCFVPNPIAAVGG